MKLIVGLGNPGMNYEGTRHNIGFEWLGLFAKQKNFSIQKNKFKSLMAEVDVEGNRCLFLLPQTYMNLSGEAVQEVVKFYKIPLKNIVVVHDELDLPLGQVKLVSKGRPAGHRGVDSIQKCLGTQELSRYRIGIGRPVYPGQSISDFVLEKFTKQEWEVLEKSYQNFCKSLDFWILDDVRAALEVLKI